MSTTPGYSGGYLPSHAPPSPSQTLTRLMKQSVSQSLPQFGPQFPPRARRLSTMGPKHAQYSEDMKTLSSRSDRSPKGVGPGPGHQAMLDHFVPIEESSKRRPLNTRHVMYVLRSTHELGRVPGRRLLAHPARRGSSRAVAKRHSPFYPPHPDNSHEPPPMPFRAHHPPFQRSRKCRGRGSPSVALPHACACPCFTHGLA